MGIRFACNQCGHVLNVKSDLAGKRGICPKCQARFDIPLESTVARRSRRASPTPDDSGGAIASATPHVALSNAGPEAAIASWSPTPAASPAALPLEMAIPAPVIPVPAAAVPDPIVEAPQLLWYVAPSGSTNQYGPASAEMFRGWIQEGRVAADSMVWRQDWSNWLRAGDVLPQLSRSMPVVSVVPAAPLPAAPLPAGQLPAAPFPAAPSPVAINPASINPGAAPTAVRPIVVGPQGGVAPVAGAAPVSAPASGWSAPTIRDQPARPAVVAVRGKLRPTINATTITIVLALLILVLVPVMWIVLRR